MTSKLKKPPTFHKHSINDLLGNSPQAWYKVEPLNGDMMHIVRMDHVQLVMPADREDDARTFYDHLLGIPEVAKPPHLAARGGCWFESGSVKVHLGVEEPFAPAKKANPAFIVRDLVALSRRLEEAGYELKEDQPLEGFVRRYVSDPFGNRIELMQPTR
jgi:catechol 2,3-dioxygenase-like lactoylglutathione lyase family enzyme